MHAVGLIRGDGIGPEIADATVRVLAATGVAIDWRPLVIGQEARRRFGTELPWESLEEARRLGVVLKAPLVAERRSGGVVVDRPSGPHRHPTVNNGLRRELDTFVNLRPVRGWVGVSGPYVALDVVIVREVTEDIYSGLERQVDGDTAEAIKRVTGSASRRVTRFACEYARREGRRTVMAIHKANVLHLTDGLFLESARAVTADYPDLAFDDRMVDAACYLLVKHPKQFDVLVMPNQYGDIVSDLVAGLVGSLGLAPGANIGEHVAMYEAAHGAAPDIAGKNVANPLGLILSGVLLLERLGERQAAARVREAVGRLLSEGKTLTSDLGGRATTTEITSQLCRLLDESCQQDRPPDETGKRVGA
jgi:isocitrate dehydrogenase (NAD+)